MLPQWILRISFLTFFKILCVKCMGESSLTFVIDDTRSMWDDIDQVKEAAVDIMNIVTREKASQIKDVVLVTFNDPDVVLRIKTSKKQELLDALDRVRVHNMHNRDCPEYALTGIETALEESRQGSYIYVFTDASAKDYKRINYIKSLCEKKQSQVVFILTGDCHKPYSENYRVYHEIAKVSNGQVFRVDKDEVKEVIKIIKETVKGQKVVVTSLVVPPAIWWHPVSFEVDDQTEYVIVSTSGKNVDLKIMDRATRGAHEMTTEQIMWKSSGKVSKFDAPKPGTYYAWVKGQSDISIVVYARTDFLFDHGFSAFVPKSLSDTSKQPIAGQNHHLSISVTDPNHTVDIERAEILDMNGKVLASLPLKKANGDFYITETFVSPSSMFKIQVVGINKRTGNVIKRISKTAIEPQTPPQPDSKAPGITIAEGTKVDIDYNGEISLTCKVSAYPKPTIVWTSNDDTVLSSMSSAVELPYDYISYLKLSNVKNPGTYYCKASNDIAKNKVSKIDVKIRSPFRVITVPSGTTQMKFGEVKTLRCDVSSLYPMDIIWRTPLKSSDYSLSADKKELTIKSASIETQGQYTCETKLRSDPTQKHVIATNVVLSDLAPPTISNASPSSITVPHGGKIHILCRTGGVPRPTVSWQIMNNDDNKYRNLPASGEELIINSASLTDAGQYQCIAKNAMGQTDKTIRVSVQKAPVAIIKEGSKIAVAYGSTIDLTCKIEAYPLPKVVWMDVKGDKLISRDTVKNNEVTSSVQIQNIKVSNTYSCYAENIVGKTVSKIDVSVTSPFFVDNHPPAITTSRYGVPTDLTCDIKSNFSIKIKWFHQSSSKKSEIHTSGKYKISANGNMLRILSPDLDMVGKYTCEATLVSDENQKVAFTTDVQIDNLSPPVLQNTGLKQITVQDKQKATISCKLAGGIPPPIVSWKVMRKGDYMFRDLPDSSQELTINRVSLADAGQYRCIAKNAKGQTDKTTGLIVQKAPESSIDEGATVTVPYGSTNVFKCRITAFPIPKIVWKDSKGNELRSKETTVSHEKVSQLKVDNIKASDTYSCYAENNLGKTVSSVQVSVTPAINFPTHLPGTISVKYKEPTDIICDAKSSFAMKIKWFYQKDKSSTRSEIHSSSQYLISPDEKVLSIASTDLDLVGKYTCEVSLVVDDNEKTSYSTKLEIKDIKAPVITDSDKTLTVMNGQKMTASCKVNGIPPPKVTWEFKPIGSNVFGSIPNQGEQISYPNIGYDQAGVYKCIATNEAGTQSRTIDVNVHGKPEITNVDSVYYGVTGDSVLKIPCEVKGVPEPTITWKREGKAVTSDTKITLDKNALFIKNPTEKDSSNFTCEAKNIYGNAIKSFEAEVSDFVDFDKNINNYIYLKPGMSADIKCSLPHSDPKSVRWYVNNDKNFVTPGTFYSIKNANFSNDGNHTCRVNTDQGSKSLNYVVDVGYEPSFTRPLSSPIINWNGNKKDTLDCNVHAKPKEKVEWFYNGKVLTSMASELPISGWGVYTCNVTNVHGSVQQTFDVTSKGCAINRTVNKVQNTPLLLNDKSLAWPKLITENEFYTVNKKDILKLACSTKDQPRNFFTTHPKAKVINAECYKEDQFVVDGKTYKFQDLQCQEFVKPFILNTKKPCLKNGEIIEVGFKLDSGFLGVYEVCYSDVDHRTLFTKVLMSDVNVGNIVGPSFKLNTGIKSSKHSDVVGKCQYNQRRLVSPVDVAFGPAQIATLSDKYNAVPIFEPCDGSPRMPWSDVEGTIQFAMFTTDEFTVWTGASEYDVNGIPRYLWKLAMLDDDTYEVIVYVNAPNPGSKDILCSGMPQTFTDITDYHDQYTYTCQIDEFLSKFKLSESDFGITIN